MGGVVQSMDGSFVRGWIVRRVTARASSPPGAGLIRDASVAGRSPGLPSGRVGAFPEALATTPMATRPAAPTAGGERPRPASAGRGQIGGHGNRLNQWAASPAPTTTRTRPAAANHCVTSRSSVV